MGRDTIGKDTVVIELKTVILPRHCANLACPNKPDEGRFVLLETEEAIVGGHRPIRLWMCSPCAHVLSNPDDPPPF
jgi:hypothetical protein